jgi:hypothetical protein
MQLCGLRSILCEQQLDGCCACARAKKHQQLVYYSAPCLLCCSLLLSAGIACYMVYMALAVQ